MIGGIDASGALSVDEGAGFGSAAVDDAVGLVIGVVKGLIVGEGVVLVGGAAGVVIDGDTGGGVGALDGFMVGDFVGSGL